MFGGILNDKNATQPAKVENDTSTSIQTTVPVTPISAAGNAAEISNKRAAPDAEEDEDLKRQKLTQETVTNVLSEAVGNAVKQIPASGTVASPKISIQPPSPSRTSSPRKTGSPKESHVPSQSTVANKSHVANQSTVSKESHVANQGAVSKESDVPNQGTIAQESHVTGEGAVPESTIAKEGYVS